MEIKKIQKLILSRIQKYGFKHYLPKTKGFFMIFELKFRLGLSFFIKVLKKSIGYYANIIYATKKDI